MFTKLVLIFAIVALVAVAGTVPAVGHYRITLPQAANVQGMLLKAGDYRLILADSKVTVLNDAGKNLVDAPVKVQTQEKKFGETIVLLDNTTGKPVISEIRLGGTKTRLIFSN